MLSILSTFAVGTMNRVIKSRLEHELSVLTGAITVPPPEVEITKCHFFRVLCLTICAGYQECVLIGRLTRCPQTTRQFANMWENFFFVRNVVPAADPAEDAENPIHADGQGVVINQPQQTREQSIHLCV